MSLRSKNVQVFCKPLPLSFSEDFKHGHNDAVGVIGGECIVVGAAVFVLDADRQIPCPHEDEIGQQPSSPAVTVNERVNGLKADVEFSGGDKRVKPRRLKVSHPFLHHRGNHVGLRRRMDRAGDDNRDAAVDALVQGFVGKDK